MLENKVYSFSELRTILSETKNEFKPKYGKGYSSGTEEKQNEKAVKDITKQVKDMDGGLSDSPQRRTNPEDTNDRNKTTLDYDFAYEPSDEYKERVKALAHGYTSKSAEDNTNKEEYKKIGDFEGNKDFYDTRKKAKDGVDKIEQDFKHSGLQSHNLDKENFKNKTLYHESKKMKRLHFKNTTFLNEEQMMKRIPDDYKVDGNKFIMKDSKGNEYLVECKKDNLCESFIHVNVVDKVCCKDTIVESLDKFYHLAGYKSSDYNKKVKQIEESQNYNKMLDVTRNLINEGVKKQ